MSQTSPRKAEPAPPSGGPRLRLDLAYHGRDFHGWQRQPGQRTVQGELARLLGRLLGRDVCPVGAGRTDAGVHARGQVCHLSVRNAEEAARVGRVLPGLMPPDVMVRAIRTVSPDFDARFSAQARRYRYHLLLTRDVFRRDVTLCVPWTLDRDVLAAAADHFLGTHDFTSFCKTASLKEAGNACTLAVCRFHWALDSAIFEVREDRFLHHMVRSMVGTLLDVGRGRRPAADIPRILAARDRSRAGKTAPARGLCLEEVYYPAALLDPDYRVPRVGRPADAGPPSQGETA